MAAKQATSRLKRRDQTRRDLITATIDSIAKDGFAETTLEKVSKRAGVSRGLVNFHFISKEKLLIETLEQLSEEYAASWRKALDDADDDPVSQLVALIESDFHPRVCSRKKIAVWYAFLGEARSRPTYTKVCQSWDKRFSTVMESTCKNVAALGDYDHVDHVVAARALGALIDSLWRELMLSPKTFDREKSKIVCFRHLANVFPQHFNAAGPIPQNAKE
ncbi:MAG TPA: TetR family transcriptional regulator C-terminal domain-containing protein [Woeseiaceae bacterium]|nr:TetR family transcriptional regulator C-terminal domain-containing protein [Woeseiaceae bacterium]